MVDPVLLCKKHLGGEHYEMHKHLWVFRKGYKVSGRFHPTVQIQFQGYVERHDLLAREIERRGGKHNSPLVDVPDFETIYPQYWNRLVDVELSKIDLCERCPDCRERIRAAERWVN